MDQAIEDSVNQSRFLDVVVPAVDGELADGPFISPSRPWIVVLSSHKEKKVLWRKRAGIQPFTIWTDAMPC